MRILMATGLSILLAACAPAAHGDSPQSGFDTAASPERSIEVSADTKVDEIVSIFENSTPELQYDYVEALGDGRGYTAGRAGFTSGTGDMLLVVEAYLAKTQSPAWSALLPRLKTLARTGSGSVSGLSTLPALWKKTADNDPLFRAAQDEVSDELYKTPARNYCKELGLTTPLGLLVIYDAIIQHGDGTDPDSLGAMIKRTHAAGKTEKDFVVAFLAVRRADLMNPSDSSTRDEWRGSVDRVDALKRIVDSGNWQLASPLRVQVFGDTYAL